jgi:hypothetical protein
VYRELTAKDDDIAGWAKARSGTFVDPSVEVQHAVGGIFQQFSAGSGRRDGADPFVIAEARVRGFSVVTYEGRSFTGSPTRNWERRMPGVCRHFGVPCGTLPEALTMLGGTF